MQVAATLLNLAWAIAGLIALLMVTRAALRGNKAARSVSWARILSVALVVSSLFPYISATDDVVRIEHYQAERGTGAPARSASDVLLVHLYEALDTLVSDTSPALCLTLFFFAFLVISVCSPIRPLLASATGRSPPPLTLI